MLCSNYHVCNIFLVKQFQEFEKALYQRDNLIEHLTTSLEQALSARDAAIGQLNALNNMQIDNPVINNMNLQQKVNITYFMFFHFIIINDDNLIR